MTGRRFSRFASSNDGQVASVDPAVARQLVAELRTSGIDPTQVVEGLGFTLNRLAEPAFRLTYEQTFQIIRRSIRLLKTPQLGLKLGANVNLASWGAFHEGLMACADTREWLEFAAEFLPAMVGLLQLGCDETRLGVRLTARGPESDPEAVTFLVENTFSALTSAFRLTAPAEPGPVLVEFAHPPPPSNRLYQMSFGCEVHFACPVSSIVFAPSLRAPQSADADAVRRARTALTEQSADGSRRNALEACLVRAFDGRLSSPPVLADIANSVHLSERTLRRRLADHGISYAEILDRERRNCALALIQRGQLPLKAIASTAGFADERSLRRAVRRWTGKSPTDLRNEDPSIAL